MANCAMCGVEDAKLKQRSGGDWCQKCLNSLSNKRVLAYLVDYGLIIAVSFVVFFVWGLMFAVMRLDLPSEDAMTLIAQLFMLILFVFKDGFDGQSPGKRVMKLQVVDINTGEPANFGQSLKRNIPFIIPFVMLVSLFTLRNEQRLGEGWAHTKVKML